jgi:hypothetical protein
LIYSRGWEAQNLRKYRFLSVKFRPLPILLGLYACGSKYTIVIQL